MTLSDSAMNSITEGHDVVRRFYRTVVLERYQPVEALLGRVMNE